MKFYRPMLGLLAFAVMSGTASAASDLEINLNGNAVRAAFMAPITETGLYANGAFLHNDDRGDVANIGVHLLGDAGVGPNPLHAGIGGQFYFINPDAGNADGEAIALGGFLRYQLPQYNRIGFGGHVYYSPGVISFGDVDSFFEYGVRADYQVLRNANIYIGYRQVKADFGPGDFYNMDTGFHVGMQLTF